MLGNGDGTFKADNTAQLITVETNPSAVTGADLDGDSKTDLAVSNFASDNVSVLFNDGSGSFQAAQNFPAGDGPIFVTSAHLNADVEVDFADLAVANQDSNNVSVLLNTPRSDTTAPITTRTLSPQPNAAGWNKEDVTVTLNATDNDSGVKQISYSVNGGEPSTVQQSSAQILVTNEGETTISYYATDNAGNTEEPKTLKVKLDRSAPTSSATARDSAGNSYTPGKWTSKNVTVELSANDGPGSGVKEISYSINGGANQAYNPTEKILVSSEGVSTISYFATDRAGNQESPPKTFTVKLDKSAPTLDIDNSDGSDGITPDDGQTGVSPDIEPTATFSEEMNPETINPSTFKLYQYDKKKKKWQRITDVKVSCDSPCQTATLNPYPTPDDTKLLAANKKFKVTVTTGAQNLAGIPLESSKSWTFATGSS